MAVGVGLPNAGVSHTLYRLVMSATVVIAGLEDRGAPRDGGRSACVLVIPSRTGVWNEPRPRPALAAPAPATERRYLEVSGCERLG
jgi:hypothetical protein